MDENYETGRKEATGTFYGSLEKTKNKQAYKTSSLHVNNQLKGVIIHSKYFSVSDWLKYHQIWKNFAICVKNNVNCAAQLPD